MDDKKYFVVYKDHYKPAPGNLKNLREFSSIGKTLEYLTTNLLTVESNRNKNYEEGNIGKLHAIYEVDFAKGSIVDLELAMSDNYELSLTYKQVEKEPLL